MAFDFTGKTVGITGAAGINGIGFAIARKFLQYGAAVFICDLDEKALSEAETKLREYGTVKAYKVDVSNGQAVSGLFKEAVRDFGYIDVFISNAGIYPQIMVCDMAEEQWDTVMAVNLKSVFLCARECRRVMDRGGVLINASSFAALLGSAGSGAYAASKAAVYNLTKTLAAELAPYQIRTVGYIPGVIETGMTKEVIESREKELTEAIALKRLGKSDDVADAVCFLASDQAAYMTGTFLEISGGKLCVQNPDYAWNQYGKNACGTA